MAVPLGDKREGEALLILNAAASVSKGDYLQFKGRREGQIAYALVLEAPKRFSTYDSPGARGFRKYLGPLHDEVTVEVRPDGTLEKIRLILTELGASWKLLKSELVPPMMLRLAKTNSEPPTRLFKTGVGGQVVGNVIGGKHAIYGSVSSLVSPLADLAGTTGHLLYASAIITVVEDGAEDDQTTERTIHPGDLVGVMRMTGEDAADGLKPEVWIFNALCVPLVNGRRQFEAASLLCHRIGLKGRNTGARHVMLYGAGGGEVSLLEPKAAVLHALRLPPPNELPTRDAPVEQLMYLSFQTEAEIAAVVGQPVLDLNKRAFFATGQLTFALAWRRSARFFRAHPQCSAALMMELLRQMREIWRHS